MKWSILETGIIKIDKKFKDIHAPVEMLHILYVLHEILK